MTALYILLIAASYLLGSVPFGLILGRVWTGVDVRRYGSGNIGATNVLRTLGLRFALATFVLDAGKGALPTLLAKALGAGPSVAAVAGLAAVVGHNWPVFLQFRGGKGIATSWGFMMSAVPQAGIAFALIWMAVVALTRYVSLASMVGAVAVPIVCLLVGAPGAYVVASSAVAVFAVVRHKSNIQRLRSGTENRFRLKKS